MSALSEKDLRNINLKDSWGRKAPQRNLRGSCQRFRRKEKSGEAEVKEDI